MTTGNRSALEHVCSIEDSPRGYQPVCSCGWRGYETDRVSNDYAWSDANDQIRHHRRKAMREAVQIALEQAP